MHEPSWPWRSLALALLLLSLLLPASAGADELEVPEPLRPWVGWVTQSIPNHGCSRLQNSLVCDWPGRLTVTVGERGAQFAMEVWRDRPGEVVLPGGRGVWPQEVVTSRGRLAVRGDTLPRVELPAGNTTISGRFEWNRIPEILPVPTHIGIVSLSIEGVAVAVPRIDDEGRLWLKEGREGTVTEADGLRVSVYRRVQDGVPLNVVTRLELNVAGRAREVELGKILVPGSRATAVRGELPVLVEPAGEVAVFVRPGTHFVDIEAVIADAAVTELTVPERARGELFDPQEVWAWFPDEPLRSVELDGLTAVDPERTTLPREWTGGTTFLADPGQALSLRETRRGQIDSPPNVLSLHRQIWFDLDGQGATSRDRLAGTMHRDWRLDYGAGGTLGRAAQAGTDLLITRDAESGRSGVEVRDQRLDLEADVRLDSLGSQLAIVGWEHDVQALSATLHLPPGWVLLGGRGVDVMRGTWLNSWTLLDFFFVLIVALSFGKLFGWRWGLAAAVALCLCHNLDDAPAWIWVNLLVTVALLRVLRRGHVRRAIVAYRGAVLVVLFLMLASFIHDQIREATHPQVANVGSHHYRSPRTFMPQAEMAPTSAPAAAGDGMAAYDLAEAEMASEPSQRFGMSSLDKSRKSEFSNRDIAHKKLALQQVDPNAVVQTGPGVPDWQWRSWTLEWSGPVRKDHEIHLWFITPLHNAVLIALRITLLILLGLLIISQRDMYWRDPDGEDDPSGKDGVPGGGSPSSKAPAVSPEAATVATLVLAIALGAAALLAPATAHAQIPTPELLGELRQRIEREEGCTGPCVVVSRADITVEDLRFTMHADVHAQRTAGWPLPGPDDPLRITQVLVDGAPTHQLRRTAQGLLVVRLEPGAHRVEVRGQLANRNVATIQFDSETRPRLARFTSSDWSVDGIDPQGVPDSSLQLTRQLEEAAAAGGAQAEVQASRDLPPWFHVQRTVMLGLPWQVRTTVTRGQTDRPQPFRMPLLEGESVITEGLRVEEGHVLVDFARDVGTIEFVSELPLSPHITLKAPTGKPWTEVWRVECSRIWRCDFDGLAPVQTVSDGVYHPVWHPWPGEGLRIDVNRPEGAEGQAVTVEDVRYAVTPGKRLLQGTLTMRVRASRGGWQPITLPEGAELQIVRRDGTETSIRPQERVVNLPIRPGSQEFVLEWQQPWERTLFEQMPTLDIGSQAVNARLSIELGGDRWLLWATGPAWGPAILFWSHLLLLLIVAGLLGLWRHSPLEIHEWLLLAIGLAQLPVAALVPVVGWFILLQWRRSSPLAENWKFSLMQLVLVGLTFVAMGCLYAAIHTNLLFEVDMQVAGADSYNTLLQWYVDRTAQVLPEAGLLSLPIWVWRGLMLLWALWLSWKLIKWLPWAWSCFSHEGLWRKIYTPRVPRPRPHGPTGGPGAPAVAPGVPRGPVGKQPGGSRPGGTQPASLQPASSQPDAPARDEQGPDSRDPDAQDP